MNKPHLFASSLKRLGLAYVNAESADTLNSDAYKQYIKVIYLPKGYRLTVDFAAYETRQPSLFFVAPNQFLKIDKFGSEVGYLIFYNRDFYCIQIHDNEVACDGLLFNNINNMPLVNVTKEEVAFINYLFQQMEDEFKLGDTSLEEMIRTYLKQLLIKATRLWKKQHLEKSVVEQNNDVEFFRKFTLLVDAHYKKKHSVADYADVLAMAPKTVTHKFKRMKLPQPNEVIKNRIILEAKRLLVHTTMTAKEIAHELGYEDPAYFSRQFQVKTGESPSGFRTKYLGTNKV
ncbi:helix-turn-helix domain-containing protein [Chryseosolibacter indicus]|uniref:Helix-turn-helix domain-containing protein n=1 Tax=Chryseosolibacter indicus TaxID=2782351 RepID=A0ABS5VRM5_9BACT|nr:helix-turn-helix domain-containing protein [Chryseosolibacter indicus]MBT1704097.1 helix-turn-helix domain-containing protein [Chryseosolibacter indicus]